MNPAKDDARDYIHFPGAAQRSFTGQEAARCQPEDAAAPAYDAFTPLLQREPPDKAALGLETRELTLPDAGGPVVHDATRDQPYAKKRVLVTRHWSGHWSGKHGRVVGGSNLLTLLWSAGKALIPCDFRRRDKPWSGLTKNDCFRPWLAAAKEPGFAPRYGRFDRWRSGLKNRQGARELGWSRWRQLRQNRQAALPGQPIAAWSLPPEGATVYLRR